MAYRGRGGRGGRGRGGGPSFDSAKAEPFVIFPEIALPDRNSITDDIQLRSSYFGFEKFWRNSPYHLADGVSKQENESLDIERFSDTLKPKKKSNNKSGSFYDYLVLRPDNFPKELLGDNTRRERPVKRAKWNQDSDLLKLDVFEKLEAKYKAEGKEENEKGEGEGKGEGEDDVDDDDVEKSESEESDNEYNQNEVFDDDEDDYNQLDDGNDEEEY